LNDLSGAPRPLEIRTIGEDATVLRGLAQDVARRLGGTPSLVDFYDGIEDEVPIREYRVNGDAAVRAGLDAARVSGELAVALRGSVAACRHDRLVPVRAPPDAIPIRSRAPRYPTPLVSGPPCLALRHGDFRDGVGAPAENLTPTIIATAAVLGAISAGSRDAPPALGMTVPAGYRVGAGSPRRRPGLVTAMGVA
jgi:hypothetical protein